MIFCSNCDNEAAWKAVQHDNKGVECPLCTCCKEAYEWGQASPESTVSPIDEYPEGDEVDYEGTGCGHCDFEGDEPVLPEFTVIEYSSFYAVRQNSTGDEHPMGDGVDVLLDEDCKSIMCGTEEFRQLWEDALNADATSTREAYFPEGDEEDGT